MMKLAYATVALKGKAVYNTCEKKKMTFNLVLLTNKQLGEVEQYDFEPEIFTRLCIP